MTAKELNVEMFTALNLWKAGKLTDAEMKEFIKAKDDQLCKEQREKCLNNMLDIDGKVRLDRPQFLVLTAPKPDGI